MAAPWPNVKEISPVMISTVSRLSLGRQIAAWDAIAPASGALGLSNNAFYFSFSIPAPITVAKMFIYNGATVAGTIDMGIYTDDYTRIVSSGAITQAGVSALQEFDVTDTWLDKGRYYFAFAQSLNTATFFQTAQVGNTENKLFGVMMQSAANPLPAVATPVALTSSIWGIPILGLSTRTLVV